MRTTRTRVLTHLAVAVAALLGSAPGSAVSGQTISGTLMEVESDRPISLGLVIMMTEAGDSITSDVTDGLGRFEVQAPEAGSFYLIASAFGFKETRAGLFELGDDGSMTVEFRVGAEALPIDGILVELQRPALQHQLVSNGFVRRLQRGQGVFLTPYDIEKSSAITSPDLFRGIPGVSIRTPGGGLFSFTGEILQLNDAAGYCTPTLYLDGVRLSPAVVGGTGLDDLVPLSQIEAAEIYRRPSEIPIEYGASGTQPVGDAGVCGVVVLWTKRR